MSGGWWDKQDCGEWVDGRGPGCLKKQGALYVAGSAAIDIAKGKNCELEDM